MTRKEVVRIVEIPLLSEVLVSVKNPEEVLVALLKQTTKSFAVPLSLSVDNTINFTEESETIDKELLSVLGEGLRRSIEGVLSSVVNIDVRPVLGYGVFEITVSINDEMIQ